ncbi:WD40-repeat-containing domain protein [Mycena vitilis]|nr:WD40-repeat-containing domain protein [Mycena vitilis]
MFSFASRSTSKSEKYTLQGALAGHTGAVVCIAANENGRLLASGGTDGTRLWCLEKMSPATRPTGPGIRGATTSILWLRREDEATEILFYGTQNGYLVCWKQATVAVRFILDFHGHLETEARRQSFEEVQTIQLTDAAEITGLAFDPAANKVVVCHRNSVIQAFTLERSLNLVPVFSVKIADFLPKAIAFGDFKITRRRSSVNLRGTDGEIIRTRQVGGMIGDADVNSRKGLFCIDDPQQGIALYCLDDDHRVRTMEVKVTKTHPRARQVCFTADAAFVIIGSDHGLVYIFDRWTGETVDELPIGFEDWVQTVTATDVNGVSTILGARSRELSGKNDIMVWKQIKKSRVLATSAIWVPLLVIINIAVVLGGALAMLDIYPIFRMR